MDKRYVYRKHLREPLKYLGGLFIYFLVTFFMLSLTFFLSEKRADGELMVIISIVLGVILLIITVEYVILYFMLFRRFKRIEVKLIEGGIIYRNSYSEKRIPYNEITKLKFPSIRYTGGWMKIIYNGGNIRLTVVLENIGDFTKSLKNELDSKGMSHVYKEKSMYNFFKTGEFSDQSWERLYENIKKFSFLALFNVFITCIFCVIKGSGESTFFLFGTTIFLLAIFFVIAEFIIGRWMAKRADIENFYVPKRNKELESKIYKYTYGTYLIVYVIILIFVMIS